MDTKQLEELRNTIHNLVSPVLPKDVVFIGILHSAHEAQGETSIMSNLLMSDVEEAIMRSLLDLHLGRKGKIPFKSLMR